MESCGEVYGGGRYENVTREDATLLEKDGKEGGCPREQLDRPIFALNDEHDVIDKLSDVVFPRPSIGTRGKKRKGLLLPPVAFFSTWGEI